MVSPPYGLVEVDIQDAVEKKQMYNANFKNKQYTEGVTYVNLKDRAPSKMIEEQVDQHVLGMIFQQ